MMDSKTSPELHEGDREDDSEWKVVSGVGYTSSRRTARRKLDSVQSRRNGRPIGDSDGFEFENLVLDCVGCHTRFDFSPGEQKFFRDNRLLNRPKRCKACRVSRKGKSSDRPLNSTANRSSIPGHMPQNRSFAWAPPPPAPPRPLRSVRPIATTLAVVVSVGQGACLACYGDGFSVELQCARDLRVGTYVSLTRSGTSRGALEETDSVIDSKSHRSIHPFFAGDRSKRKRRARDVAPPPPTTKAKRTRSGVYKPTRKARTLDSRKRKRGRCRRLGHSIETYFHRTKRPCLSGIDPLLPVDREDATRADNNQFYES